MNNFLADYILHLADTTLILAQRNAEWCGHGPILEQDIAITNISLDLIGQSRNFYQYAATLIGGDTDEDKLAYLRKERAFKNLLLAEQPNGDWGQTILRQYLFSQYQYLLFEKLQHSKDEQLAAITTKALKEIKYHLRWSSEWVIRLGDGTEESSTRMLTAIDELWRYTGEMFVSANYELQCAAEDTGFDCGLLKEDWLQKVKAIFDEAALPLPEKVFMQSGGKEGTHTEHLGYILAELQYVQRAYPNSTW
ncbi:1,2-phenylacetyl-CoA epoxidase subunit PaaC [Ferruginibacter sp. SUN106]|uniref:1,2-phenylacetyl-CoA epoxidase subunit PaaC n=1 Tax=Ferruginibacter sp. SUN106 TaxID=2978348 RepID=UPI003D363DAE